MQVARGEEGATGELVSMAQELQTKLAAPMQQLLQQRQRADRELHELQAQLEGDGDASRLPEVDAAIQVADQEVSSLTTTRDDLMNKRTALADDKVKHGRRCVGLVTIAMRLLAGCGPDGCSGAGCCSWSSRT